MATADPSGCNFILVVRITDFLFYLLLLRQFILGLRIS